MDSPYDWPYCTSIALRSSTSKKDALLPIEGHGPERAPEPSSLLLLPPPLPSSNGRPFPTSSEVAACRRRPGGPMKLVSSSEWGVGTSRRIPSSLRTCVAIVTARFGEEASHPATAKQEKGTRRPSCAPLVAKPRGLPSPSLGTRGGRAPSGGGPSHLSLGGGRAARRRRCWRVSSSGPCADDSTAPGPPPDACASLGRYIPTFDAPDRAADEQVPSEHVWPLLGDEVAQREEALHAVERRVARVEDVGKDRDRREPVREVVGRGEHDDLPRAPEPARPPARRSAGGVRRRAAKRGVPFDRRSVRSSSYASTPLYAVPPRSVRATVAARWRGRPATRTPAVFDWC